MPRHYPARQAARPLTPSRRYERRCSRPAYVSDIDAKIALGRLDGKDATIQHCPVCGGWHVLVKGETLPAPRKKGRRIR